MDTLIVAMLNALGAGVSTGTVSDLLKSPDTYNATLYNATVGLHDTAVKPVTAVVLAIVAVMSIAAGASRFDQGDQQLGIRMIASAMFRIVIVLAVTESAMKILAAIDQVVVAISGSANAMDVGATASGTPLGDSLKDKISDASMTDQLVFIIVLLIPWLVAVIVSALATVLVFVRFLQLYVMTAFASLPIAFAGMETTRGIAIGFVKRYATVGLQGAVLIISLKLYQALMAHWLTGGIKVDPNGDIWDLLTQHIGTFFVAPFVLAFVLFGATSVARAIVGEG